MIQRPVERVLAAMLTDLRRVGSGPGVVSAAGGRAGVAERSGNRLSQAGRGKAAFARRRIDGALLALVEKSVGWLITAELRDCPSRGRQDLKKWCDEDPIRRIAVELASRACARFDRLRRLRPLDGSVDLDLLLSPRFTPRPLEQAVIAVALAPSCAPALRAIGSFRHLASGVAALCLVSFGTAFYAENHFSWGYHMPQVVTDSRRLQGGGSQAGRPTIFQERKLCGGNDGQLRWCGDEA